MANDRGRSQTGASRIDDSYQMAPPLHPPRTPEEIEEIVAEEITLQATLDGGAYCTRPPLRDENE